MSTLTSFCERSGRNNASRFTTSFYLQNERSPRPEPPCVRRTAGRGTAAGGQMHRKWPQRHPCSCCAYPSRPGATSSRCPSRSTGWNPQRSWSEDTVPVRAPQGGGVGAWSGVPHLSGQQSGTCSMAETMKLSSVYDTTPTRVRAVTCPPRTRAGTSCDPFGALALWVV